MFRRIAVFSVLATAAVSSTASADLTFTASGSPVSIPVILLESPISDTLTDYTIFLNFDLPASVTYHGVTDVIGIGSFLSSTTSTFADLQVSSSAPDTSIPTNLTSPSTTLFTIEFNVTADATGDINRAISPVGDLNTLQYKLPNPAFPGPSEPEFISQPPFPFTFVTNGSSMVITAVPEPSEWILGFLMTGLLGTIASKRFFAKKKVAEAK